MDKISTIAKIGILILVGALTFILTSRWAGVSADAIIGLAGAVVGAVIAASIQFFTIRVEQIDRYRLAAIDKRLQAHQEAFTLWSKLISKANRENEIGAVVLECQAWWNNNCLYLEEKARKAFYTAYICAANHKDFLMDRSNPQLAKENWGYIVAAGDALAEAVALPPVGELVAESEKKPFSKQ